jgi:hypothetical protein
VAWTGAGRIPRRPQSTIASRARRGLLLQSGRCTGKQVFGATESASGPLRLIEHK